MTGDLVKHMLEKRQARIETRHACAVQVDAATDLSFESVSVYLCFALYHCHAHSPFVEIGALYGIYSSAPLGR